MKPVTNYKLGAVYSLATAVLLSIQAPFSALAARSLTSPEFICLTQLALLFSVPLLTVGRASRRDFAAVLFDVRNWGKLAILFAVGITGLFLYNIGLSSAHPFVTAGVLNLTSARTFDVFNEPGAPPTDTELAERLEQLSKSS